MGVVEMYGMGPAGSWSVAYAAFGWRAVVVSNEAGAIIVARCDDGGCWRTPATVRDDALGLAGVGGVESVRNRERVHVLQWFCRYSGEPAMLCSSVVSAR
jgi:hypothetical protein